MQRSAPRGFTMIELLVVVGLSASTLSVVAPAIQRAREAARQAQCRNNFKQFGLALHNYHDAYRTFPPGWISKSGGPQAEPGFGWQVMLLPFLEQAPLYNRLNAGKVHWSTTPGILQTQISVARCPSDSTPAANPLRGGYGTSNYSGVYGSTALPLWSEIHGADLWPGGAEIEMKSNGAFTRNSKCYIGDFVDGTSNTIMLGERCVTSGAGIWAGVTANQNVDDALTDGSHASPLNKSTFGFSSRHAGGANFCFADGSVRFLADGIDSKPGAAGGIYQRLTNKSDGQVVGEF